MVSNNNTACGLAQEAANRQSPSNVNTQPLKDWYRFYTLRSAFLSDEEMATLRAIALVQAGVA